MTSTAPHRPSARSQRLGAVAPQCLHPYFPTRSGKFDAASRRVLNFKDGSAAAAAHYLTALDAVVPAGVLVAAVPSHSPLRVSSPVVELARALGGLRGRSDASGVLLRMAPIQKLSRGGARGVAVHLASVGVARASLIQGRPVILIDDVVTTGNSMTACKRLLLEAGAARVDCYAISKTTY